MTVLVCGATGNTGRAVVRALVAHGAHVRALTRDPAAAPGLAAAGAEPFVGDLADPAPPRLTARRPCTSRHPPPPPSPTSRADSRAPPSAQEPAIW